MIAPNNILIVTNEKSGYFATHWGYLVTFDPHFHLIELNSYEDWEKNQDLISNYIQSHQISAVFFQHGLLAIKTSFILNLKCTTVCFVTDDDWMYDITTKHIAGSFDYIITTYPSKEEDYLKDSILNVIFSQWGFNPSLFKKKEYIKNIDVSFIGAPHSDRRELMKFLLQNKINVKVYGKGWERFKEFNAVWGGSPDYETCVEIINRSKINLNPSTASTKNIIQIKGRTFELAGCGAFQLTTHADELNKYFVIPNELVTYDTYTDLLVKINYYLTHDQEREKITEKAYARAQSEHTWDARFSKIFSDIDAKKQVTELTDRPDVTVLYFAGNNIDHRVIESIFTQVRVRAQVVVVTDRTEYEGDGDVLLCNTIGDAISHIKHPVTAFIENGETWDSNKLYLHVHYLERSENTQYIGAVTNFSVDLFGDDRIVRYSFRKRYYRGAALPFTVPSVLAVRTTFLRSLKIDPKSKSILEDFASAGMTLGSMVYVDLINPAVTLSLKKFLIILFRRIPKSEWLNVFNSKDGWQFRKKNFVKLFMPNGA